MFYTSALAKIATHTNPMFQYLGGNGGREINAETIAEFCADVETAWNNTQFPYKPTSDELVKYFNLRNKTDPDDRDYIVSDHHHANSELYIFLRYCVQICALDSYGRCETIEGSRRALARGTQALQTGVLMSHIKKLRPWLEYQEEFNGWKETIAWLSDGPFGTAYTNQEFPPDKERLEIGESWNKEIKQAFDRVH